MNRWLALTGALWLLSSPGASALDDSLFDTAEDVVADESSFALIDVFEGTKPLKISGKTTASAGYYYGWKDLDRSGEHGEGLKLDQTLAFDAKPLKNLSAHAAFSVTYPAASTNLALSELYVDTVALNLAYVRVGKTSFSWGSAKIFNIVNLASDTGSGITVRAAAPWKGGSLTGYLTMPVKTGFDYSGNSNFQEPAFDNAIQGARLNLVGSGYDWHLAWRHRLGTSAGTNPPKDFSTGLKLTFWKVDVFADGYLQVPKLTEDPWRTSVVTGFFTERALAAGSKEKVQLYAEYQYDRRVEDEKKDHRASGVVKFTGFGRNKTEFGVQWSRSWLDDSNEVLFGYAFDADDGLRIKLGVPWLWGPSDSSVYFDPDTDYRLAVGCKIDATLTY